MVLKILEAKGKFSVSDESGRQALLSAFFGRNEKEGVELGLLEAMYLMDTRDAKCFSKRSGKELGFCEIAKAKKRKNGFFAGYCCYRDWRNRGLVALEESEEKGSQIPEKGYPVGSEPKPNASGIKALFFEDGLVSVSDDPESRALFDSWWFGQYGSYKAPANGRNLKLDCFETIFLLDCGLECNANRKRIEALCKKRMKTFPEQMAVYSELRRAGFVVKSGFKFGTHFRMYFPGARPEGEKMHSRHVIHVFSRREKMLASELARAIRVAHGVKKTFVLAVSGARKSGAKREPDFVLWHRTGGEMDKPEKKKPRYGMICLSEDEMVGGEELEGAIRSCEEKRLWPLLAICSRETSITYYKLTRVRMPKSESHYYEAEWFNP